MKYVTCIITDSASAKYIPPTIGINKTEFVKTANATTAPPNAIEPVSPINTLAGFTLNTKNPIHPPIVAAANVATATSLATNKANATKKVDTTAVIPEASPSRPSVKFTALTVPIIMNIIIGTYKIPKSINLSVNGIIIFDAAGEDVY